MKNYYIPTRSNPSKHLAYHVFFLALLAIFFGASVLSAAANQQEHHHNSAQFGNIAPAVTAVAPGANSIGVPINTKIIAAAFTKPMDHTSLTPASFTLSCRDNKPIPGTVAYLAASNAATLTLSAATELPAGTQCTATIISKVWDTSAENVNHVLRSGDPLNIRVKDTTGTSLMNNYSWTFTTGAKPDNVLPRSALVIPIASISMPPAATQTPEVFSRQVISMPSNTAITAVFSEDMSPKTINASSFRVNCKAPCVTPNGDVSYEIGTRTAIFTPDKEFYAGTAYTVTITSKATDLAGNPLAGNQASWNNASRFVRTVLTTGPAPLENTSVLDTYPVTAALEVCPSSTINAVFSVPSGLRMNPLTVSAATFTLTGPAPAITPIVAASVTLDRATGNIATFTPLVALDGGATYTARITGYANGVNDLAIPASEMNSDYTWSFTTAPSSTKCFTPIAIKSISSRDIPENQRS